MAVWWVFQNKTYKEESEGSFLWAPMKDPNGNIPSHWKTMTEVEEGDIVLSSVGRKIVAVSTVMKPAYTFAKPFADDNDNTWESEGWKVDLFFTELKEAIDINNIVDDLMPMMDYKYAPLNKIGNGNTGYLFPLTDAVSTYLLNLMEDDNVDIVAKELEDIYRLDIPETEKERLVKSRVGQGEFRKSLMDKWDSKCAVTGLNMPTMLIASHSKAWKVSNNRERLDGNNGLLLSPSYDSAFDKGYISFDEEGCIIFSPALSREQKIALSFDDTDKIQKLLNSEQKSYLTYHRNNRLIIL